jgi:hypothetical protein
MVQPLRLPRESRYSITLNLPIVGLLSTGDSSSCLDHLGRHLSDGGGVFLGLFQHALNTDQTAGDGLTTTYADGRIARGAARGEANRTAQVTVHRVLSCEVALSIVSLVQSRSGGETARPHERTHRGDRAPRRAFPPPPHCH